MMPEISGSEPYLQTELTRKSSQPDTDTGWMDEMERELEETEKKWPMIKRN